MDTQQQIVAAQQEILNLKEEIKQSADELQHTLTSVSVLYQISSELSGIDDKDKAGNAFVAGICKMFSIDVGVLIEVDRVGLGYKTIESIGLSRAEADGLGGQIKGSVFEKTYQDRKPSRLDQPGASALPDVVQHLAVKSALLIPIIPSSQPELILLCCRMYAGEFSFEEERVINILSIKFAETLDRIAAQIRAEESLSLVNTTIESMSDGILVADLDWHITLYNKRYTTMWHIPQEIMYPHDVMKAIQFVSDQMSDPVSFFKEVDELRANPESISTEVFELKDGTVIERNSVPQRVKDKTVGRVWSFRDITGIKHAEKQLEMRMQDLEELNGYMVDRELKMVELKKEIKELRAGDKPTPASQVAP
jgi:PAS domain-containing protein